jgi:beta-xylosidase
MSGIPMTLSYATSEDGLTWTHMTQDTPIFDIGPTAEWRAIWATDITYVDGTYFLFAEIGTGSSTDVHVMTYEGTFGQ